MIPVPTRARALGEWFLPYQGTNAQIHDGDTQNTQQDIARVVMASIEMPRGDGRIYNVADNEPCPRQQVTT